LQITSVVQFTKLLIGCASIISPAGLNGDPFEISHDITRDKNFLYGLKEKFGKIVQIPTQGKGTYKKKSRFGVCTITVGNVKLKNWILNEIAISKLPG